MGDYHHSNPEYYKADEMSCKKVKTHKENYQYTMNRLKHIEELGYKVFYIWITDFRRYVLDLEKASHETMISSNVNIFDYMNIEKSYKQWQSSGSSNIDLLYKGSTAA